MRTHEQSSVHDIPQCSHEYLCDRTERRGPSLIFVILLIVGCLGAYLFWWYERTQQPTDTRVQTRLDATLLLSNIETIESELSQLSLPKEDSLF